MVSDSVVCGNVYLKYKLEKTRAGSKIVDRADWDSKYGSAISSKGEFVVFKMAVFINATTKPSVYFNVPES